MTTRLAGVWLKEARAREHMQVLKTEMETFLDVHPHRRIEQLNPDTGEYVLKLTSEPTPPEWGPIVGDVIHNLRSALDHLVWELAVSNGKVPPPFPLPKSSPWADLQFPIVDNAGKPIKVWGVSEAVRRYITAQQPLPTNTGPIPNGLYTLRQLSNIDKHRRLHTTGAYLMDMELWQQVTADGEMAFSDLHVAAFPAKFTQDTEILRFTVTPPNIKVGMDKTRIDTAIGFDESLGRAEGVPVIGALAEVGVAVATIITYAEANLL
jgi:hypothetical protein